MRTYGQERSKPLWKITSDEGDKTWLGYTLRKPPRSIARETLNWNPQGRRNRVRPQNTLRRELEKDIKRSGHTWKPLEMIAETGELLLVAYAPGRVMGQNK